MPNPSNSDLVGEAKRLSADLVQHMTPGPDDPAWAQRTGKLAADAAALLPELADENERAVRYIAELEATTKADEERIFELAQQLEQAEQRTRDIIHSNQDTLLHKVPRTEAVLHQLEVNRAALTPDEGAEPPVEEEG